jgi:hypothetical protein
VSPGFRIRGEGDRLGSMSGRLTRIGDAGLVGWRKRAMDRLADPIAARTGMNADQIRAIVGWIAIVTAAIYLVGTLRRASARS